MTDPPLPDSGPGGPHAGIAPLRSGPALEAAAGLLILIHGRGADAADILSLVPYLGAEDFHTVAPQAADRSWYPLSFMAPVEANEPGRSSALEQIDHHIEAAGHAGCPPERVVIAGFSQGACLATEYAHTRRRRYGAVIGFSGGLIGPDGMTWEPGSGLDGTPVFLGCSDRDPHIPRLRVGETALVLQAGGAVVDERIYPGMGHTVNADELTAALHLIRAVADG